MEIHPNIEYRDRNGIKSYHPIFDNNDIFKYGKLEYLEKTLENNTLKFSRLSEYNDPFEMALHNHIIFQCPYSDKINDEKKIERLIRNSSSNKVRNLCNDVTKKCYEYLSKYVVSCFSMTPDEPLMWSHYSDEHRGICYCFDKNTIFSIENNFSKKDIFMANEINYSQRITELTYSENFDISNIGDLKPQFINVLLTKSINWSYEREFRFFIRSEETKMSFNPKSLQAIIIGLRVRQSEIEKIQKQVKKYNENNKTNVQIMYASQSVKNYEMSIGFRQSDDPIVRFSYI